MLSIVKVRAVASSDGCSTPTSDRINVYGILLVTIDIMLLDAVIADCTNSHVESWVVLVFIAAVTAVGIPRNVGEVKEANVLANAPPKLVELDASVVVAEFPPIFNKVAVPVILVPINTLGVPRFGVINIGEVLNTFNPVPELSVTIDRNCVDDNTEKFDSCNLVVIYHPLIFYTF